MSTNKQKRINDILPVARALQSQYGIPASVTIAQAIQESGWMTSTLASVYNNWFGEKAGSSWRGNKVKMPTSEYVNGEYIKVEANFRAYTSMEDAIKGRGELLSSSRYQKQVTGSNSVEEYVRGLKRAGYATDPDYDKNLMGIIRSNNLTQYDTPGVYKGSGTWKPTDPIDTGNIKPRPRPKPDTGGGSSPVAAGELNALSHIVRVIALLVVVIFTLLFVLKTLDVSPSSLIPAGRALKGVKA
ncbi:hypothetical protein E8L90_29675 [Brevibacillus antibioticus]|uniref:Mannosyl-glycoprotein endo-beta-N-acetylglucosamidase-like domain-containing protein n=1 Tax=Brevibacillus antibioticus TaxID=2570228 RepID=A0A4U2XYE2_9BACL|nr:glucosaminidase domain-containing protein [Brevibacillus antibioticus]TKI52927.1 hypothetical protein E8L90_29675 [Brevibacillus antibioticus]